MEWDKVKLFYHVVKTGSITAAAEKLNVSQPALSRSILNLEKEMGITLLIRKKRGVTPTNQGQQLYDHAKKMADSAKLALHELTGDTTRIRGPIRIVTTPLLAQSWVVHYLSGFQSKYKYLRTHLHSDETSFLEEKADVHIAPIRGQTNYTSFYLATVKPRLYASRDYLKKHGIPKSAEDLDNHRILYLQDTQNSSLVNFNWILRVGRPKGTYRKCYMKLNTVPCLLKAAELGMGVVELTQGYPEASGADLIEVLPELEGPEIDLYLTVHKNNEKAPRIQALLSYIKYEHTLPEKMPVSFKSYLQDLGRRVT